MADVNKEPKSPLTQSTESGILVSDDDCNPISSFDSEVLESGSLSTSLNLTQTQQTDDSNLTCSQDINTLNDHIQQLNQNIIRLQDEVHRLQAENEDLKSKSCDVDAPRDDFPKPLVKIQFEDESVFEAYRELFVTFLKNLNFEFKEDERNLIIEVSKDGNISADLLVSDATPEVEKKVSKKKKRKRKSKEEVDSFFVLDTTPSLTTHRDKILKYESKFNLENAINKTEEGANEISTPVSVSACFNCNENHTLKDCPVPRDSARINAARQKFRNQIKVSRYHLEDDQKYSHLKPGQISENLRNALGLFKDEIPSYIYKMRRLGYPPGWLEEAQVVQSDLTMYDFDGKNVITRTKKKPFIDPEKIIDFPGFNVPLQKGIKDNYRNYRVPPYSEKFSKEAMLQHIKKLEKQSEDNLDVEDMELATILSDKEPSPIKTRFDKNVEQKDSFSPSLVELESKKHQLLAELNDNTNGSTTSGITIDDIPLEEAPATCEERKEVTVETVIVESEVTTSRDGEIMEVTEQTTKEVRIETKVVSTETATQDVNNAEIATQAVNNAEIAAQTINNAEIATQDVNNSEIAMEDVNSSEIAMIDANNSEAVEKKGLDESLSSPCIEIKSTSSDDVSEVSSSANSPAKVVKTSAFGTPILKSASPYCKLPSSEKFSKNICDVINFENLPNSTGKYEQMTGILQKVRKTLKNLNERKS